MLCSWVEHRGTILSLIFMLSFVIFGNISSSRYPRFPNHLGTLHPTWPLGLVFSILLFLHILQLLHNLNIIIFFLPPCPRSISFDCHLTALFNFLHHTLRFLHQSRFLIAYRSRIVAHWTFLRWVVKKHLLLFSRFVMTHLEISSFLFLHCVHFIWLVWWFGSGLSWLMVDNFRGFRYRYSVTLMLTTFFKAVNIHEF
jgi:hypothetical protein